MKPILLGRVAGHLLAAPMLADGHRRMAPEGPRVYIVSPPDSATVSNPVSIVFSLEGMGLSPAKTD